jgi:hypothetical protein
MKRDDDEVEKDNSIGRYLLAFLRRSLASSVQLRQTYISGAQRYGFLDGYLERGKQHYNKGSVFLSVFWCSRSSRTDWRGLVFHLIGRNSLALT